MLRAGILINWLLLISVLISGIGVAYAKYMSRKHFVELESLRAERERIDIEWGRLQLEQSSYATHGRVEKTARSRLGMRIPTADEVVVIKP